MRFIIEKEVLEKFPQIKIGILVAKGLNNTDRNTELDSLRRNIEEEVRPKYKLETLVNTKKINDWREAYIAFGSNPKTFKNSVEALLRRVLKGQELPNINKIVDIYNTISIKHCLPIGGDDLDKVEGDIRLTIAIGGEQFTMLGNNVSESVEKGEVVYRDNREILCRRWNWRESDKTKMIESTKNVCLVIEGLGSTTKEEIELALREMKELVEKYCNGKCETYILDNVHPELEINGK